ncbi:MAG: DUF167 domain-containing protein [Nitrospirae bacterium]|nr:DUF167 domain-containing protein [Nitrospirota bacterium]
MKISVKVKTGSKKDSVNQMEGASYLVSVKAQPVEGKANEAIIKILSDYFNVPKSNINILRGEHSKNKVIEIL